MYVNNKKIKNLLIISKKIFFSSKSSFTRFNLYLLMINICFGFTLTNLYAVSTALTWGTFISFHSAILLDPTSFYRIAEKKKLTIINFHIINFAIHILPCIITLIWTVKILLIHGIIASILHISWGMWQSHGTLVLDDIYVPLPRATWCWLWLLAVLTELSIPIIIQYFPVSSAALTIYF